MKKFFLGLLLVGIVMIYSNMANAVCTSNHAVMHPNNGVVGLAGTTCPTCAPRFWCLSSGTANNNGAITAWFENYSAGVWWYNGSWGNGGIVGCCGMWEASGGNSRTMMAAIEYNTGEGTATHAGMYEAEVCERPTSGTDFSFNRAYDYSFKEIPYFRIAAGFVNGPIGGTSSFNLMGWGTIVSGQGPANYWAILQNGTTTGTNVVLNALCSGGATACPAPIAGYQIRAAFNGCVGGVCPAPIRPTSSLPANWAVVAGGGGVINSRVVTFPLATAVTVANPASNTVNNAYLWIATQLRYADGFVSNYVSRNNSAGVKWLLTGFGAEIDALTAKYITPSDVRVNWLSVVEGTSFGYNVYRSFSPTGTFTKVNAKPIPVLGDGSSYAYKDRVISPTPRNVYYKIGIVRDIATGKDSIQENLAVAKAQPK
jgi:hypothetical protein